MLRFIPSSRSFRKASQSSKFARHICFNVPAGTFHCILFKLYNSQTILNQVIADRRCVFCAPQEFRKGAVQGVSLSHEMHSLPQRLKAEPFLATVAASLKRCPDTNRS
jgi:hypothetical protein